MPLTPDSAPTSYLTPTEFLNFIDVNMLAQLYGSNGVPLTQTQLVADARVQTALDAASGDFEASALVSERYTSADLAALTGVSLAYMKSLIADIAVYRCYTYRDGPMPPQNIVARNEAAQKVLEKMRAGEEILSFKEAETAGLPSDVFLTPQEIYNLNLVSNRMDRVFGIRQNIRR